ncbi:MAG: hypothetical protein ACPGVO_00070 [Spirulinaceae cyanobacterium]
MTQNGTLETVKFLPADLAKELNCTENEIRIAAKKHNLSAPYTAGEADTIRLELAPPEQTQSAPAALAPQENAAPVTTPETVTSPAFGMFCDALQQEITQHLTTEMQRRMPEIKTAVIDAVMPTQQ